MPSSATARTAAAAARSVSPSLGRTTTPEAPRACCWRIALDEPAGRGAAAGPGAHDDGTGVLEEALEPDAGGAGHDRGTRPRRRAASPRTGSDPRAEAVGSSASRVMRTRCGPARLDAGLDGRAGVVDVGVDVPLAVTADDEHGVAELDEAGAQHVHGGRRRSRARRYITSNSGHALGRRRPSAGRTAPRAALGGSGRRRERRSEASAPERARWPAQTRSRHSSSTTSPAPPASTTPARASTSSCSGVCSSASREASSAASATACTLTGRRRPRWLPGSGHDCRRRRHTASVAADPAACAAASAIARATVRIVPSLGSVTAWRARSSACRSPSARTAAVDLGRHPRSPRRGRGRAG